MLTRCKNAPWRKVKIATCCFGKASVSPRRSTKARFALAQIYGLHIPVVALDDRRLTRLSQTGFARGYNPEEPRVPKGDPHGGEWTTGEMPDAAAGGLDVFADTGDGGGDDGSTGSGDDGDGGGDSGDGGSDGDGGNSPPRPATVLPPRLRPQPQLAIRTTARARDLPTTR